MFVCDADNDLLLPFSLVAVFFLCHSEAFINILLLKIQDRDKVRERPCKKNSIMSFFLLRGAIKKRPNKKTKTKSHLSFLFVTISLRRGNLMAKK